MKESISEYGKYLAASLLVHGAWLAFLLLSVETGFNAKSASPHPVDIVQAVVVDEQKVTEEVDRLQTEAQQQKLVREVEQKQLAQKLEQIKQERAQEQAKLLKLKEDMAKAKQEEQRQLEALKQEKEKEKKNLAALDDQRQAEQDRVKQMRLEREKEEKKRVEVAKQQQEAKRKAEEAKRLAAAKAAQEAARVAAEKQAWARSESQKIANAWGENVKINKLMTAGVPSEAKCELGITVLPDGSITVNVIKSSGYPIHDEFSKKAAYKTQPFPMPEDPLLREQLKYFTLEITNGEGMG